MSEFSARSSTSAAERPFLHYKAIANFKRNISWSQILKARKFVGRTFHNKHREAISCTNSMDQLQPPELGIIQWLKWQYFYKNKIIRGRRKLIDQMDGFVKEQLERATAITTSTRSNRRNSLYPALTKINNNILIINRKLQLAGDHDFQIAYLSVLFGWLWLSTWIKFTESAGVAPNGSSSAGSSRDI